MYNKLFTKILDSSIWLEPTPTRIVWLTLIAGMDEDGFVALASVANLAHRARVELAEATEAVRILESPDENSSDPDNEGRRIERVTGGWIVLNAPKYRDLVTRTVAREQTRIRVQRCREKRTGNADVTASNGPVTQSEAVADTKAELKRQAGSKSKGSEAELTAFVQELGLPASDGKWLFLKWESNGWTNNGKPIRDWKGTIRAWQAGGFMASQKGRTNESAPKKTDAFRMV